MAIAFVNSTNNSSVGFSITLNKPTGVSVGDLMIGVVAASNTNANVAFSIPTGWTQIADLALTGANVNTHTLYLYRYFQVGDPTSWSTSGDRSAAWVSITSAYSGVDSTTPFVVQNSTTGSNTTPTVNNTVSGAWRVASWTGGHASFAMDWSGYSPTSTERQDLDINGSGGTSNHSSAALVDSNGTIATGNTSVTATPSSSPTRSTSWIGILNPAATGSNFTFNPSDAEGLTDTLVKTVGKTLSEAEGLTDTRIISQGKTKTEAEGLTDTTSKAVGKVKSESQGLTDSTAQSIGRAFSKTEALSGTDTLSLYLSRAFSKTEAEGLTDTVSRQAAYSRPQSDSDGLSDAMSKAVGKNPSEALGLADNTVKSVGKAKAETLGLSDTTSYILAVVRNVNVSDAEGLNDSVSYILARALTTTESDSLGFTDHVIVSLGQNKTKSESLGITDSTSVTLTQLLSRSDITNVSDAISRVAQYVRSVSNTAGLTDNVTILLARQLFTDETETSALTDRLALKVGIKPEVDDVFLGELHLRVIKSEPEKSYTTPEPTKKWTLSDLHSATE